VLYSVPWGVDKLNLKKKIELLLNGVSVLHPYEGTRYIFTSYYTQQHQYTLSLCHGCYNFPAISIVNYDDLLSCTLS